MRRSMPHVRASVLMAATLAATLGAGCVTESKHRDIPPPPSDARATSVQIFAAAPRDTNNNGYGDTISVMLYLFDEQRYPLSLAIPGSVRFNLKSNGGHAIASWSFSPDDTRRALQSMGPGPGYRFELSLLDKGGDQVESQEALLSVEFTPVSGTSVASSGGVALRLGKIAP